jgi:uncharacterized membrane protein YdjX (TVP38/TMEM64 family)
MNVQSISPLCLQNLRKTLKILALASIALFLTTTPVLAQEISRSGFDTQGWLRSLLQEIDRLGAIGAILFIGVYSLATIAFLPGSLLTLGAGVVFGVVQGAIYVWIGATLGATLAFLIGRYLARGWVAQRIAGNPKFKAIDEAVGREGFKIVLLTRLSPVFPFNLLNYAFGITGVSLQDYILGCVGMIPGTMLYVYLGSLAGNIARVGTTEPPTNATLQWSIRLLGLLATVAVALYVTRLSRRALSASIAPDDPPEEQPF